MHFPAPPAHVVRVAQTAPAGTIVLRAQALSLSGNVLVFTSGDSFTLADGLTHPKLALGQTIRVHIDAVTHLITSIDPHPVVAERGEIDTAHLAGALDPSLKPATATGAQTAATGQMVTITINVTTPLNTPPADEIYLSTDRTNYSLAELRMNRIDPRHWSVTLALPAGTILNYQFSRGYQNSVERDRSGAPITPHSIVAAPNAQSDDTVLRWADLT
jgi:hypothetical protein